MIIIFIITLIIILIAANSTAGFEQMKFNTGSGGKAFAKMKIGDGWLLPTRLRSSLGISPQVPLAS